MHVLGIDIGTSAVKAVLADDRQDVVAEAERPLATQRPREGWSEQDPAAWWQAVQSILDAFHADDPRRLADVGAIGLSGQMHGAVLLGRDDRPLRPAILWNDGRAAAEAAELAARHPALAAEVGVVPMAGFTAPKLTWLARHEPALLDHLHTVLLPKDYVRLQLTGERLTDMSDAAGTWWLDEERRRWSGAALDATGAQADWMPSLCEGSAAGGRIRHEWTRRWGIPATAIVAGGAGDAAAGAVGIGAVGDGDAFVSLGTSAQLFVSTAAYRPAPETLVHAFAHALPGRWYQMGAMLNGASALGFMAGLLGADIETLLAEAEGAYRGPSRLLVLPYLTGERTPHNNPDARGVVFGLDPAASRADLAHAVMEGVAFSIRDAQAALHASGTPITQAGFIGGGARSHLWTRILASVMGVPLVRYRGGVRGPAFGAARLARLASTGEPAGAVCRVPDILDVTEPDPALWEAYAERHGRFQSLYRHLQSDFRPS